VPFRCLNVTAILSSFAEHKPGVGPFQASREFSVAFKLRPSGSFPELPALGGPSECVRVPSSSTRGVDAFDKCSLRSVAFEYGQTPKDVLSGAFKKLRRTVSTTKFVRMSRRFARTDPFAPLNVMPGGADAEEWAWRSVEDIARDVLKNTVVSLGTESPRNARS
jgi:hypothetical protein